VGAMPFSHGQRTRGRLALLLDGRGSQLFPTRSRVDHLRIGEVMDAFGLATEPVIAVESSSLVAVILPIHP
jgi:hypothetical protein